MNEKENGVMAVRAWTQMDKESCKENSGLSRDSEKQFENGSISPVLKPREHQFAATDKIENKHLGCQVKVSNNYGLHQKVRFSEPSDKFKQPVGSLDDVLKDCRRKFFNIEREKAEASIMSQYEPIKIASKQSASKIKHLESSLEECFSLGKRKLSKLELEQRRIKEENEDKWKITSKKSIGKDPFTEKESLGDIMKSSVKKFSKLSIEKNDERLKLLYNHGKKLDFDRNGTSPESELIAPKACLNLNQEFPTQITATFKSDLQQTQCEVVSHNAHDDMPLKFSEDLLREKDSYMTIEDKIDRAFQHKSVAVCHHCQKPLFNKITHEKTKSLRCGKKFHIVSLAN